MNKSFSYSTGDSQNMSCFENVMSYCTFLGTNANYELPSAIPIIVIVIVYPSAYNPLDLLKISLTVSQFYYGNKYPENYWKLFKLCYYLRSSLLV